MAAASCKELPQAKSKSRLRLLYMASELQLRFPIVCSHISFRRNLASARLLKATAGPSNFHNTSAQVRMYTSEKAKFHTLMVKVAAAVFTNSESCNNGILLLAATSDHDLRPMPNTHHQKLSSFAKPPELPAQYLLSFLKLSRNVDGGLAANKFAKLRSADLSQEEA